MRKRVENKEAFEIAAKLLLKKWKNQERFIQFFHVNG